jgi:uncharacterized protein
MSAMFEFDPEKSAPNLVKHGIDFDQAQALWLDTARAEVRSVRETEERWLLVGTLEDRYWTAVYTMRETNVRIISVRRSRENEVNDYVSRKSD